MNEFPLFFLFIAIKIGQKVAESSDVILPRPQILDQNSNVFDSQTGKLIMVQRK
jgi:hypothetical protein